MQYCWCNVLFLYPVENGNWLYISTKIFQFLKICSRKKFWKWLLRTVFFCAEKILGNAYVFCSYFWIFSAQTFTSSRRYAHFWIIGTVIKQCHQVLAVATNNSISHLVGILNLCLVIKKIDLCCLIVKEMAKVSYHVTLPRILSTQVFSLSYIILIVWRPLR